MKIKWFIKCIRYTLMVLGLVVLAACGSGQPDLSQWMQQQKKQAAISVKPLDPPRLHIAQSYVQQAAMDPYAAPRLLQALRRDISSPGLLELGVDAEFRRKKEPLELFPLENITFVGKLEQTGKSIAMVNVDKHIHRVVVGQYVGQNFGRIIKINDGSLTVRELIQDATGEWKQQIVNLEMQAKK